MTAHSTPYFHLDELASGEWINTSALEHIKDWEELRAPLHREPTATFIYGTPGRPDIVFTFNTPKSTWNSPGHNPLGLFGLIELAAEGIRQIVQLAGEEFNTLGERHWTDVLDDPTVSDAVAAAVYWQRDGLLSVLDEKEPGVYEVDFDT